MYSVVSTYITSLEWNFTHVPQEMLWYMTGIFLILMLLYLGSAFYFRTRLKNKSSKEAQLKKELAPMISKFLFYTEEHPLEAKHEYIQLKIQIRQLLKDGLTRSVLSEVLQDLKKDVSGSARKELLNLYVDLGLQEDAIQRLKKGRWEILSRAILELTEMEVGGAYGLIKKYINHRSSIVRKQAQIATVSLKKEGIVYFLDTNRYPISEWQQLKLLDVIRHMEGFEPPKFKNWLTSKNTDVVLFALRLIKYYKQNDAQKAIIRLVNHRNQQVKIEAIQCIREFYFGEAREALKMAFNKGNEEVKLLILDTLGLLGDLSDIQFIQNIVNKNYTHVISSKASSVINILKPETILPVEGIDPPEEKNNTSIEEIPENMEKEEEALPVQLPKPDFPMNTDIWEDFLDPDFEDECIFSHCCLEEFRDLIQEIGEPLLKAGDPGTLPLDFLPIVTSESEETTKEIARNHVETKPNSDYSLQAEERITREIEALMERENENELELEESEDDFNLNFLPILVEDSYEAPDEGDNKEQDLYAIEVIAETLKHKVPDAFKRLDRPSENYSLQIPPEASTKAVKAINWSEIAVKKAQQSASDQQDMAKVQNSEEEVEYGFSIFQELFRTADTESKLILLDEVLAIGDEKELHFLKSLAKDPSDLVRKKAVLIQGELATRLNQFQETEKLTSRSHSSKDAHPAEEIILQLNFEPEEDCFLDPDIAEVDETKQTALPKEDDSGHFLGRFIKLSHKILEMIYG